MATGREGGKGCYSKFDWLFLTEGLTFSIRSLLKRWMPGINPCGFRKRSIVRDRFNISSRFSNTSRTLFYLLRSAVRGGGGLLSVLLRRKKKEKICVRRDFKVRSCEQRCQTRYQLKAISCTTRSNCSRLKDLFRTKRKVFLSISRLREYFSKKKTSLK